MKVRKQAAVDTHCVACGTCMTVCPFAAIEVVKGVIASVDEAMCKGCKKCEAVCPAGAITMRQVM